MKVRVLSIGVLILAVVCLSYGMIIADRDGANKYTVRGDTKEGEVKIEKEIFLSPRFYFMKSGEKTARLLREGKELRALTQIELYKKRIAPVNQYDPAARRVSDL